MGWASRLNRPPSLDPWRVKPPPLGMASRKLSLRQVEVLRLLLNGTPVTREDSSLAVTIYALRERGLVETSKTRDGGWEATLTPDGEIAAETGWVPPHLPVPRGRAKRESNRPSRKALEKQKVVKEREKRRDAYKEIHKATRDSIKGRADERGMISSSRDGTAHISVSRPHIKRALRLLKLLFAEAAAHGVDIGFHNHYRYGIPHSRRAVLRYLDYETEFAIKETATRSEHVLTSAEISQIERYPWTHMPRWDFTPSGNVSILLDDPHLRDFPEGKSTFKDLISKSLEERVPEVIAEIVSRGEWKEHLRQEELRKQAEYEAEQQRLDDLYQAARARAIDAARSVEVVSLRQSHALEQAERWVKAQTLRAYVAEMKTRSESMESKDWLAWMAGFADLLDPVNTQPMPPEVFHLLDVSQLAHRLEDWPSQRPRNWRPTHAVSSTGTAANIPGSN